MEQARPDAAVTADQLLLLSFFMKAVLFLAPTFFDKKFAHSLETVLLLFYL